MSKTIIIDGVIGWDTYPRGIRNQLDDAKGEDIIIEISSPGGFVFDGLEIFNLLKNYEGKVTTHMMGLAASMASYIALAGDYIKIEKNSVFMIHNARAFQVGDQNALRKTADVLEGISNLLAHEYVNRSGKSFDEIVELMNNESFFFGDEIVKEGFADEIIESDKKPDKKQAIALAKVSIENCISAMKKSDNINSDFEKVAAFLNENLKNEILNESTDDNLKIIGPFANEHSARLLDPDLEHIRVRRTKGSGAGRVQGVKVPNSISIIWYIVKTSEGKEAPRAQSLRFPITTWTEKEARKWLKDNEIKYILFEKATEAEDKKEKSQNNLENSVNTENQNNGGRFMTLDELKAQFPELHSQIFKSGIEVGIEKENKRCISFIEAIINLPITKDIYLDAIKNNKDLNDPSVFSAVIALTTAKNNIDNASKENPDDINTNSIKVEPGNKKEGDIKNEKDINKAQDLIRMHNNINLKEADNVRSASKG
jgi:ATP-dependent protease ClpP protease subunit